MTDNNVRKLQLLNSKYAALARSKYSFGAGTAKSDPTPEQLADITAQMAAVKAEMASVTAKISEQKPTVES